jgi:hypothetical protein
MSDDPMSVESVEKAWPSIDDATPLEEGGSEARKGFNYQDEVAVSFLLEMIENDCLLKIHFETHDDLTLVRTDPAHPNNLAEYVQVKGGEPDKLWSTADLCMRKDQKVGSSIFEASLAHDRHAETARFRMVTMRQVANALVPLTYRRFSEERKAAAASFQALHDDFQARRSDVQSDKGNGCAYWLDHCEWDTRHDLDALKKANCHQLVRLSFNLGMPLLFEQADVLLDDLRRLAKDAGAAKWIPHKAKKIIIRAQIVSWWSGRLEELKDQASSPGGEKLKEKLSAVGLPEDMVALAVDLRREYAAATRTPRYMESGDGAQLQRRVKSEAASLRSNYVAGYLDVSGAAFHAVCLEAMDKINADVSTVAEDQSAFLKGCLYDIADRCLLRFERPQ